MRTIDVYFNNVYAGLLSEVSTSKYMFRYADAYVDDPSTYSISVTLPKSQRVFESTSIFPFFTNMLPEGGNRRIICRMNKIDESDFFGMLMAMRGSDFIGAVNLR